MALEREALTHRIEDDLALRNRNWNQLDSHLAESAKKHITESGMLNDCFYIKFDDGTLIQAKTIQYVGKTDQAWGNLYSSPVIDLGSWAIPFIGAPYRVMSLRVNGISAWLSPEGTGASTDVGYCSIIRPVSHSVSTTYRIDVIGIWRWK